MNLKPTFDVCKRVVEIPTIIVDQIVIGENHPRNAVFIQWFGEAVRLTENFQFLFELCIEPNNIHWMGHPEEFKVVFLGQIKNWPKPEVSQKIADEIAEGNLEQTVAWLCSHHYQQRYESGIGPGSFTVPVVLLGDPNIGLISPKTYQNLEALKEDSTS